MTLFEKILYFLDAKMTTPTLYGIFHIISLLLVVFVTAFLILKFRNASDKTFRRIVLVFWIIILLLEIYKQINYTFRYNDGDPYWDYQWYIFPFQFCSTPMYALPMVAFLPRGKVRNAFIAFLCYFSLVAGIAVLLYPADVFIETIGINIQTMIHHGSQVALGIYFAVYKRKEISIKFLTLGVGVLLGFIATALLLNVVFYNWMSSVGIDETFNMFYISPYYNSTLPVFSALQPLLPYPIFLFLYVFAMLVGGFAVLAVQKAIVTFSKKIRKS